MSIFTFNFYLATQVDHKERKKQLRCDLITAAWRGNLKQMKQLLDQCVSPDVRFPDGQYVNEDGFTWFQPPDIDYGFGLTPLHAAAYSNCTEAISLLLDNGANINIKDNIGTTPLHNAANKNYTEVVKLLLTKGALVNLQNHNGWTPLHFAAFRSNVDVIFLLLQFGANTSLTDSLNQTPLNIAHKYMKTEVIRLLEEHDAKSISFT